MIPANALLLTDLYELAMLEAYHASGMDDEAVFDFFVRDLPSSHGYLVAAGLEQVLATLRDAQFSDDEPVDGEPLLELVMVDGEPVPPVPPVPSLADARQRYAEQLRRLPPELCALDASAGYSLEISERVQALAREADRHIAQQLAGGDRP